MKSLIIGAGEVGTALYKVLKGTYPTVIMDRKPVKMQNFDVMHICFPYSDSFVQDVRAYQVIYAPKYTVIHSTVPVGTTKEVNEFFQHFEYNPTFFSPIRGVHPYLAKSIKTFVKYLSPPNRELKHYFEKCGIKVKEVKNPDNLEALKVWCTTQYGLNIILEKEIYRWCQEKKLDFDIIYTESNKTYNEGYRKLSMPKYSRYVLKHMKGGIGGHCVLPNLEFIKSPITKFIHETKLS